MLDKKQHNTLNFDENLYKKKLEFNKNKEVDITNFRESQNNNLMSMVELVKSTETNKIIETQALALSYHIMINEEISKWLIILTKAMVNRSNFNRDRFIFYASGCSLSTSKTEKDILLEGDLTEDNKLVHMIESYIDFLRDCKKICENIQQLLKNKIQLMNL